MLLSLIYGLVRLFLDALLARHRTDRALRLEVVVLRQQLHVLERQLGRPRWKTVALEKSTNGVDAMCKPSPCHDS